MERRQDMGLVRLLDAHRMQCDICKTEWVAHHPLEAWRLECPSCKHPNRYCPDVPHDNLDE